ncbi:K(+) efflux antiporter 2, chloroplastic [Dendrobium catenatum]|uniref:K(+) efflux antiporter 2, chloroplastic n=1 Tax=Dendrobium catenatum TaxID=906689 RepID=A0A2I0VLA3_9ASPA|nr:K(+) efflux antiporter 2, chloroplastic [Dendrobium catenatum]XP_020682789.1 K(+) efflux antiporter 2, chloroplastic [Dendrobium catenatum]XP_020682790.1 K(+) efflux antiporter 2, chloroplastic [Dendrobium catenatum]XP_020682791.1 K(+) efflux antiporter 2, chloroplastic [Dendrobium catenatum]PKU64194.1 K(+) efflux antiporter 2, chloroplastic [Dendrobium catenatum]
MDIACSFWRSGISNYRVYSCFSTRNTKYRSSAGDCSVAGDARFICRLRSTKRGNNHVIPIQCSVHCSGCGALFSHLNGSRSPLVGSSCNCRKLWRETVWLQCQRNDSLAYIDGDGQDLDVTESPMTSKPDSLAESTEVASSSGTETNGSVDNVKGDYQLEDFRESLQKAMKELEVARLNSIMFEQKAQSTSESAFDLKDKAENAWRDVTSAVTMIQEIINEETIAKEAVQKATMALSMAEARLRLEMGLLDPTEEISVLAESSVQSNVEQDLLSAQEEIQDCKDCLNNYEADLMRIRTKKEELQKEVDRLSEIAEKAQLNALKAEEDVTNIMFLAEQAVAFELEVTQHVNDAELALQKAEKVALTADLLEQPSQEQLTEEVNPDAEKTSSAVVDGSAVLRDIGLSTASDVAELSLGETHSSGYLSDQKNDMLNSFIDKEYEVDTKVAYQGKKQELQSKDLTKDSPLSVPKGLLKKSSRFFSASFFSFNVEGKEFTPATAFERLAAFAKKHVPNLVLGTLLLGLGTVLLSNRAEKNYQLLQQPELITSIEEVTSTAEPMVREIRRFPERLKKIIALLPQQEIKEEEASLFDMLWLLLASVIFVPIFQKIPGGSPVLGYLAAGILIGPYGLSIIRHVHGTKAIAEFGVVFLLFNIGLELSVERLSSMKKYVFGLGSAQVLVTAIAFGLAARFITLLPGPAAIVIGNGLALSSTAVVLQVLQERGESTSRHGRATFSVLLFQDLAVVVLLILIPLISPNSSKGGIGFQAIAEALGIAAVKAMVAITAIIAGGRLLLRPIYKQIAENQNAEIFSANTLLVILGTSLLTARAGLSMALGAFLAGLLLAETEFSLQVESDIAPYRGLLLGLFFMTVGMSIDPKLLLSNFPVIVGTLSFLICGKCILVALLGKLFGLSSIAAIRVGLLLAPGGEFAFVAFGEAVNQGILSSQLSSLLFLVVGISMAVTPWLAAGGQLLASRFEQLDVRSLLPVESETDDLQDHIIICGFGRVGQIIAQLLSERLIPFVALDVRSDRVAVGRALDLPVYFGDAGSREVLHKVGAARACAAAITLDTPGANYRTVWALSKYFPNVKTFVRAHDVDHGINLEKAGATAVVPETLEPSLQLAAAVLAQAKLPTSEIATAINEFRTRHLSELTELCEARGGSLGYGFSRVMSKTKSLNSSDSDDDEFVEGTLAI